ncbi:MAG: hypothetical protein KF807_07515 [Xanthobacteraceae bacterium]|nr:hypothetical protein [Xanthobacteraceae bacterium]
MKRLLFIAAALLALSVPAFASAGFSCEADDKNVTRLVIGGATPRSGGNLINFGAELEIDGEKIVFRQSDVKRYFGEGGVIRVRVGARTGERDYLVMVDAKRNPKDEDDWSGTYEVRYGPAAVPGKKTAPQIRRGKVKCFVE